MDNIRKIEDGFSKAFGIGMNPNNPDGPPVIMLLFKNEIDGVSAYDLMTESFKDRGTTIVFTEKTDKMDVSFIDEESLNTIVISDLEFSHAALKNFCEKVEQQSLIHFAIGSPFKDGIKISRVKKNILLSRYILTKMP